MYFIVVSNELGSHDEFNIAKLKKNYSQEFVLKINNDGRITYV